MSPSNHFRTHARLLIKRKPFDIVTLNPVRLGMEREQGRRKTFGTSEEGQYVGVELLSFWLRS
jgi:hypothetical protein